MPTETYDEYVARTGRALCVCSHTATDHGYGDLPQPGRCTECDCPLFEAADQGFIVRAQIKGWKNKLLYLDTASTFNEARAKAREFFAESTWLFRIERMSDGKIEMDDGFDPTWEEP